MFAKLVILVGILAVVVALGARRSEGAGGEERYVVRRGDTVWSIAAAHYGGDPRESVWRLRERNHLVDGVVRPGQQLLLP
jgi:hypothetical protein